MHYHETTEHINYNVSDILRELTLQPADTIKVDHSSISTKSKNNQPNTISNVIFNDPATIVFWADGTKTVVKAQDEAFDPEKGLAMAICKKVFGNEGNYFNQIKKWTEKYEKPGTVYTPMYITKDDVLSQDQLPWRIWMTYYDHDGNEIGFGVHPNVYTRKSSAVRRAKQLWGANPCCKWTVSQTNPWTEEKNNGH